MFDAAQPRTAWDTTLPAAILAAALFALLALVPLAAAAPDPVASGTTTITLSNAFSRALKESGVKLLGIGPASVKGKTVTLPVSGGSIDPLNGRGILAHSGDIRLKAGRKSVALTGLELNTSSSSLSGKINRKRLKLAAASGLTSVREGFGVRVSVAELKLTGAAAKQLNGFLAQPAMKTSAKGAFKANQVLGRAVSATQPKTVAVLPGGNATLVANEATLKKLQELMVEIQTVSPTVETTSPLPAFEFPIGGGSISPAGTAGAVQTQGGLKLIQNGSRLPPEFRLTGKSSTISLNAIYVDLETKSATVEVTLESTISTVANGGNQGRGSIADISLTGATVTANPTTHTVSIQNATATLQALTAEVLNSVFGGPFEAAGAPHPTFAAGDGLGTFSFTAQTQ